MRRLSILAALLALLCTGAFANDIHYTYVQTGWVNVDPDAGSSGSGPALDLSYGVTDLFHVVGLYNDIDFDPVDATTWGVGGGVHTSLSEGLDLVGEAAYIEAEVDVPLVGEISEDGYQVCASVRAQVSNAIELEGGIEYVDLGAGDDTALVANARWNINQRFAAGAGFSMGDDANTLSLGFRINFGRR